MKDKHERDMALFLRVCLFNHSGVPNCEGLSIGDALAIFSVRDIKKGEELTILYDTEGGSHSRWGF